MTDERVLHAHDGDVVALQTAVRSGDFALGDTPRAVALVLRNDAWRERIVRVTGEVARFTSFAAFVRAPRPDGLGSDVATVKRLCRDDQEVTDMIDAVTGNNQGARTDLVNNIDEVAGRPRGTSRQKALRDLRTKRRDLHARVLAGELSPHGAMVAAGLRERTVTVPLKPDRIARTLRRHLTPDQIAELVALLTEDDA